MAMCPRLDDWEYLARPALASGCLWAVVAAVAGVLWLMRSCRP